MAETPHGVDFTSLSYPHVVLQVFVEYVMLAHVNDGTEQAQQLGALLQGRAVVLNLIPWNPVYSPEFDFKAPGHERTQNFQRIVREYGVHCTVRQEKGQDISGMQLCHLDLACIG